MAMAGVLDSSWTDETWKRYVRHLTKTRLPETGDRDLRSRRRRRAAPHAECRQLDSVRRRLASLAWLGF